MKTRDEASMILMLLTILIGGIAIAQLLYRIILFVAR
jgi:hypothetical protein